MVSIPSRHRSFALLAGVIIVQVLLLAVQIKRDSHGRLIRVWAVGAVSPVERGGNWGLGKIRGIWNHYFALQSTQRENEALRSENDSLKLALANLQGKAAEADRLGELLKFRKSQEKIPMISARVIGASAGTASRTIEIDRGERDGIRRNLAVITPDGAVGKVIETFHDTAQVLLLTDKEGGAGAMILGTRTQSPVGGNGEPYLLMKYVANDDTVNIGEQVVTSGMDKIFPRDIPVGTVMEVKAGNPFKQIRVKPAAHLDRLEEVIVLLTQEPLTFSSKEPGAQDAAASGSPTSSAANPPTAVAKP
jgi:rod shape-determining protein MreC